MKLGRVYSVASVLVKSQLRAGRSGRFGERFFSKPVALLELDAVVFVVCAIVGEAVAAFVDLAPQSVGGSMAGYVGQGLVFLPALVPSMVIVAGILFELSVSSKFATSDCVNWLPVSQAEYVTASAISVSYNYSLLLAVLLGVTSTLSFQYGLGTVWAAVFALSVMALFLGGVIVEVLRAAVNRVSSLVYGRARRGALVLRLLVTVLVIMVFQFIFNFVFLMEIIDAFTNALSITPFIPVFWPSLAAQAALDSDPLRLLLFSLGSLAFIALVTWFAVRVRTNYWAPSPVSVSITRSEYTPHGRGLERLGLTPLEAAVIRKDLKGFARRREMLQYLAIPVVITAVLFLQIFITSPGGGRTPTFVTTMPIWFVGGFFALMISSISFGQEGRSVMNLYSLPITAGELFRAKAFISLVFALTATLLISFIVPAVTGLGADLLAPTIVLAVLIAVEETFIGLGFGSRFPDFQERPRPRFVDPVGILVAVLVALATMIATVLPIILLEAFTASGIRLSLSFGDLFAVSLTFGGAVSAIAFLWARSGVNKLLREMRL